MHFGFPKILIKLHGFLGLTTDLTLQPQPVYQPHKKLRIALEIEKRIWGRLPQRMTVMLHTLRSIPNIKEKTYSIFSGHLSGKHWQLCGSRKLSVCQWGRSIVRSHGKSSSVLLSASSNSFQEMSFTCHIKQLAIRQPSDWLLLNHWADKNWKWLASSS